MIVTESDQLARPTLDWISQQGVHHLSQYFGVWCVQEQPFLAAVDHVRAMDLAGHVRIGTSGVDIEAASGKKPASGLTRPYQVTDHGVALIDLVGTMTKYGSSLGESASTIAVRRQVRQAAADAEVSAILLRIDSPGGTSAGTEDLASDVAEAGQRKPVWAFIEDLGASAAYWVASRAARVVANRSALVGSIGTYVVIQDRSSQAAALGIKVHVVRAGKFKGSGTPGTEITQEQLAEWQRVVDGINEQFMAGVAQGRRLPVDRVREMADGRVHLAPVAQEMGLVDAVQSLDQALAQIVPINRRVVMSQEIIAGELKESAATVSQIEAACPGADAEFCMAQLKASATASEAARAWAREQSTRLAKANEELAAMREKLAGADSASNKKPETAGYVTTGKLQRSESTESGGDAVEMFDQAVATQMGRNGGDRSAAIIAVASTHPELHRDFLQATNHGPLAQRLIQEKFGGL